MTKQKWSSEAERNKAKQKAYRDRNRKQKPIEETGKYVYIYDENNLRDCWRMLSTSILHLNEFSVSSGHYGSQGFFNPKEPNNENITFDTIMEKSFFKENYYSSTFDRETGREMVDFNVKIDGFVLCLTHSTTNPFMSTNEYKRFLRDFNRFKKLHPELIRTQNDCEIRNELMRKRIQNEKVKATKLGIEYVYKGVDVI